MGRKIPGRKHKGVKDPLKQLAKRNAELQSKINLSPINTDFQELPKSVERLATLRQAVEVGAIPLKKKKKKSKKTLLINTENYVREDVKLPGMTKPDKPIPSFHQRPGETDKHFLYRINQACQRMVQEVKFEEKYGVDVNKDPETGKVIVTKQQTDELGEISTRKKEKRKQRKQKLEKIKHMKMEKNQDEFQKFQDNVKFGETVHGPPTLKAFPRKANTNNEMQRPGRKDLLLKPMLQTDSNSTSLLKKTKRKNLPVTVQQQMEMRRIEVVEAYRKIKSQQHNPLSVQLA